MTSLEGFSEATRRWFNATFAAPTPAQEQGWAAISRGEHTLIHAPTGSGKTLAAFLWALDRLLVTPAPANPRDRCRVLYVSPLKALTYDIERNLQLPLAGVGAAAGAAGDDGILVGTRTGDTSAKDRRGIARRPPDVLATTPESLYLMLTSAAREAISAVEFVIVDEIHAVAGTKRGAHLAVSLERLERNVRGRHGRGFQRIGLSATQRPLQDIAAFLGGKDRAVTIVDTGARPALDLTVTVPVEDLSAPGDLWPAIHPQLVELIRAHRSTLIFVNSRAVAERLASRLNDEAGEELVRAHHGSIAHEKRVEIERALKQGSLPALVATSSLELGIDMGAIDLVVQVQAPSSVASGLQRIGRAGHSVGAASKGRIMPRFRGDLLVAAVIARGMRAGEVEATRVPKNPLDVLAQHIVAMVAIEDGITADELYRTVTAAAPFTELTRSSFDGVLDMLAGRYPSTEFGELRPRIIWDRPTGQLSPRAGASTLAVTSGGTIADRGLYRVVTHDGTRVGELDEEMVYENREGRVIVLGATSWRIDDIDRNRVIVSPAPGQPGMLPFWRGDAVRRPYELGREVGRFLRELDDLTDAELARDCGLDDGAVTNLRAYVDDERRATGGVVPTDKTIVVERFRDELGDWRVCVLSPFGAGVHAPWGLAVEEILRRTRGFEVQTIWGDDGIVFRLPEVDDPPGAETVVIDPVAVEELVVDALSTSALFAVHFRDNAARSLLLPRRRPGERNPLWLLRQRAADLQVVASRYGDFPVLLETYRECLQDVFDLPALVEVLSGIANGDIEVASVDSEVPSPFAGALVWSYVHTFVFESDAPVAERRAQALTLDRRLLAELLGTGELRDLIEPGVLARVEAELQALDPRWRARTAEQAGDLLRRLGDLTTDELEARADASPEPAVAVRIAGQERLIAPEDAGRYRDALVADAPPGLPAAFLEPVPDALEQLVARYARTHIPFLADDVAARFGLDVDVVEDVLNRLATEGRVVHGEFLPDGMEREWCDAEVLRSLRRRSLAAYRKEVEPTDPDALARFLPAWHGMQRPGVRATGDPHARLRDVVAQLEGFAVPVSVLERDVLATRVPGYLPRLLDDLGSAGEVVWVGAGTIGRTDGRVALFRRGSPLVDLLVPLPNEKDRPADEAHDHIRSVLAARGAAFFPDLRFGDDRDTLEALWDLVWAGEVTNDSFAPLRAFRGVPKRKPADAPITSLRRPRLGTMTAAGPPAGQGRWSLVERGAMATMTSAESTEVARMLADVLLDRHGVLTRPAVRAEAIPGGFASVYPVLRAMEDAGRARRGYFVAELGGAQFASPGAVDRLRQLREAKTGPLVLAATDPANPFGAAVPWPEPAGGRAQRVAGAYVVLLDGVASIYVERNGRGLVALRRCDRTWEADAIAALDDLLGESGLPRIVVERVDPGLEAPLREAGYVPTPKGFARYRH